MAFLTSTRAYETYVEYWNSKVNETSGHSDGHAVLLAVETGVTVVGERRNPHQCNPESGTIERCGFTFQCGDLALDFSVRSGRKRPIHGNQAGELFDVLLLRFERGRRSWEVVARRIRIEFVKKVEREPSNGAENKDKEPDGPQPC